MIRDTSDGSVRDVEALKRQQEQMRECSPPTQENSTLAKYRSGLPLGSSKPENIARLEKSRGWLRDYRAGKFKPQEPENA